MGKLKLCVSAWPDGAVSASLFETAQRKSVALRFFIMYNQNKKPFRAAAIRRDIMLHKLPKHPYARYAYHFTMIFIGAILAAIGLE